jgi:hypothetical protein
MKKIIHNFGFNTSTPTNILVGPNIHFNAIVDITKDIDHNFPYKEMIRSLQYANVGISLNIFFLLINKLSSLFTTNTFSH